MALVLARGGLVDELKPNYRTSLTCNGRSLNKTNETLAVALDGCINPVTNWNLWTKVWVPSIDITLGSTRSWSRSSIDWQRSQQAGTKQCSSSSSLHVGIEGWKIDKELAGRM